MKTYLVIFKETKKKPIWKELKVKQPNRESLINLLWEVGKFKEKDIKEIVELQN